MDEPRKDARTVILEAAATAGGEAGEHLSFETLSAYRAGELPEAETDRVAEHLAHCRPCAERLLDVEVFEEEEAEVPDAELERELRRLDRRLAQEAAADVLPGASAEPGARSAGIVPLRPAGEPADVAEIAGADRGVGRAGTWRLAAAFFAGALVVATGAHLGLFLGGPAPAPVVAPAAAPPAVADLSPITGPTRGSNGTDELRVAPGRSVSLILHQTAADDGGGYTATVTPPVGEPFTAPLEAGPTGLLVLTLGADAPAGRYRIDLHEPPGGARGARGEPGRPLAAFELDLARGD